MNKHIQAVLAHLTATPAGATKAELMEALHIGPALASRVLVRMGDSIVHVIVGGSGKDTRTRRYFAPEHLKLEGKTAPVVPARKRDRKAPTRLVGEATNPNGVQVQVYAPPPGRFEFNPPPGWKGVITQDWERERGL